MKTASVPSQWIHDEGSRLDAAPYLSGAMAAKMTLEKLKSPCDRLGEVTKDIFHAGRESRRWVTGSEFGIPFLSSSDILKADLSDLPLLSKKQVERNPGFLIRQGWTLITRSGTIGRMVYVRRDMDGMACSEHAMRVVPDEDSIPPGYLYAFLRSRFGIPMVVGGTYGSIIQSIEPDHVIQLPVPRIGARLEKKVHELVEKAAELRTQASSNVAAAVASLHRDAGLKDLPAASSPTPHGASAVSASAIRSRFDAFFHSTYHKLAREGVRRCSCGYSCVADLAVSIVEPTRFKRIHVDDEQHGVPFFGTTALFWSQPAHSYLIPKSHQGVKQYIVERRSLLIPRSGQLSGIIGTVVLPHGSVVGAAVTEDAIRVHCPDDTTAGFLYIALSSEYGVRQLKARAYGSSIPHLDVHQIGSVIVPDPGPDGRATYGKIGIGAGRLRDEAIELEQQARIVVEKAIEEAT